MRVNSLSSLLLVVMVLYPEDCYASTSGTQQHHRRLRSTNGRDLPQPFPAWPLSARMTDSQNCASTTIATSRDGTVVATSTCDNERLQIWSNGNGSWHAVGPTVRRPSNTTLWGIDLASETDVLALGGYDRDGSSRAWVMAYHIHGWISLGDSFAVDPASRRLPRRDVVLSADGSTLSVLSHGPELDNHLPMQEEDTKPDVYTFDSSVHQWVGIPTERNNASDAEARRTGEIAYYYNRTNDDMTGDERVRLPSS